MKYAVDYATQIIYHGQRYQTDEINEKVDRIAYEIAAVSDDSNKCILIFMDRCLESVCSVLSVLKLGKSYIPVSINTPKERVRYILKDSKANTVVTISKHNDIFCGLCKTICIDELQELSIKVNYQEAVLTDPAYIIYTSGTTGHPKGVEVSYGALESFIEAFLKRVDLKRGDSIAYFTDFSFDISFIESTLAVLEGLTIVMADEEEQKNPRLIAKLIQDYHVTVLQMTPSRLQLLIDSGCDLKCLKSVQQILVGGEVFTNNLLKKLKGNTTAKIFNLYGPTEATIWVTVNEQTNEDNITIGTPFDNSEIFIVNELLEPVDIGDVGEILITGKCLANQYVNSIEMTHKNFVFPPFLSKKRAYRTGDLGRYNSEGKIEFIGRIDNQIKLNGYRIELEEIESVINQFPNISQSLVQLCINFRVNCRLSNNYMA